MISFIFARVWSNHEAFKEFDSEFKFIFRSALTFRNGSENL